MKKNIHLLLITLLILTGLAVQAQYFVPSDPSNKNVIFEEFTGVKCPNCPSGHQLLAQILASNPGRAFAVAYHPFNSSYTLPYTGDPDFRRHYADSLYMTPWCGTSRYMPSAFVARRQWTAGERLTQRTYWEQYGNTIMAEPSPLNVGMATRFDPATQDLTVVVDVYYTASVTGTHDLMVTLAENDLQSQQSGGTNPYTHKHTFREAFVGQWGDFLSENAQQGNYYRKTFTFNNAAMGYNMDKCELVAFVLDKGSEEVISGIGCDVNDTTFIPAALTYSADTLVFETAQQCLYGLTTTISNQTGNPVNLNYVQQESIGSPLSWYVSPWPFTTFPYAMAPGGSVDLTVYINIPLDNVTNVYYYDSLEIQSDLGTKYIIIAVNSDIYTGLDGQMPEGNREAMLRVAPNPVRDVARIEFFIPGESDVTLDIMDMNGRLVKTLLSGRFTAGNHTINWNGKTNSGSICSEGVYFCRLYGGNVCVHQRILLMLSN